MRHKVSWQINFRSSNILSIYYLFYPYTHLGSDVKMTFLVMLPCIYAFFTFFTFYLSFYSKYFQEIWSTLVVSYINWGVTLAPSISPLWAKLALKCLPVLRRRCSFPWQSPSNNNVLSQSSHKDIFLLMLFLLI